MGRTQDLELMAELSPQMDAFAKRVAEHLAETEAFRGLLRDIEGHQLDLNTALLKAAGDAARRIR